MKTLSIVILSTVGMLSIGCHNYNSNVGEILGCTLAGNGCDDGRTGATGLTGAVGLNGTNGTNGTNGSNGSNGLDGADGSSCSVSSIVPTPLVAPNGGARITCTDGTDALLLNGSPGTNGTNAPPTPYSVVQVVKPCPTIGGSFPEVLLVMQDRSILASASANNGKDTRLALLTPGTYSTTDGRSCTFTVGASTISWAGGSVTY